MPCTSRESYQGDLGVGFGVDVDLDDGVDVDGGVDVRVDVDVGVESSQHNQ